GTTVDSVTITGERPTLPTGTQLEWDSGNNKIKFSATDSTNIPTATLIIGSDNYKLNPAADATKTSVSVEMFDLVAGQSYSFAGKTVVATQDLSAEQVAQAFTQDAGSFDGGVVVGDWDATNAFKVTSTNSGAAVTNDGANLIITNNEAGAKTGASSGIKFTDLAGVEAKLSGAGTAKLNDISGTTTDGQKASQILADSYVTYALANAGGKAASGDGYVATSITLNTNALDSITNFDAHNDKIALKKFNASDINESGLFNTTTDIATSIGTVPTVYVGTAGAVADASIANGIINFSTSGGDGTETMTLQQKLYVALETLGKGASTNTIAGFEDAGDFYVIATGTNSGGTTDDLVIKLNGVSGVTDITTILA
ncbi:MAG: hypothetical protein K2N20_00845, partial [Helicobacter sp.]|nr:hypothetical protein [Helicobacter sp.]